MAETLVEMGRRFEDDKILYRAVAQYKFLRREYPGSKYRVEGLFTIGEIYKDDLDNPEAARAAFEEFLRHYPGNHLADDARQALAELNQQARVGKAAETQKSAEKAHSQDAAANNARRWSRRRPMVRRKRLPRRLNPRRRARNACRG